jgi:4-amino-4-deoxy-L-arabinose transferase-like glycosyltransferase
MFGKTSTIVIVFLILLWLYAPSLEFPFLMDDYELLNGSRLTAVSDVTKAFSPVHFSSVSGEQVPFYRPLATYVYFGVMQALVGANALCFRIINLCLMALISFMIYFLIVNLKGDKHTAFIAAILFPVNMAHALTQLWISCTPELFATFFATASVLVYIMSVNRRVPAYLALSGFLFSLALLSKEIGIAVPGIIILFEALYYFPKNRRESFLLGTRLCPFLVIVLGYLFIRLHYFNVLEGGAYGLSIGPFVIRYLGVYVSWAIDSYLAGFLGVLPLDSLFRDSLMWKTNWGLVSLKFLLVAGMLTYFSWKQNWRLERISVFAFGWFLCALFPVLFAPQRLYHYYLLLPDVGLMLLIGSILSKIVTALFRRSKILAVAVCAMFMAGILAQSTLVIRREEAKLRMVALRMRNVEKQLLDKVPNPPDGSGFVFTGDYNADWLRSLSCAIRVLYNNPTLNATGLENGRVPEKAKRSTDPVYFVHVQDGIVHVTYPGQRSPLLRQ